MRTAFLGGFLGVLAAAAVLVACGSSGGTDAGLRVTVDELSTQLAALTARLDAHEADADAHHAAPATTTMRYVISTVGSFPSRNKFDPDAGDGSAELSVDPFLGGVAMFAGNFAPRGWAFCEGQLLSINQNQALFSLLGTTYGGDGRTTFALPDLRGRHPMHPAP